MNQICLTEFIEEYLVTICAKLFFSSDEHLLLGMFLKDQMEFLTFINWTSLYPFEVLLGGIFHFNQI